VKEDILKKLCICFLVLVVFLALGFISFSHSAAIQEAKTTAARALRPSGGFTVSVERMED